MAILEQALAELRRQNEEKSTLLAELRHRMKNNLQTVQSLLRIQKSRTQNAAVRCELAALETHVAALNGVDGELLALEGDRAIDLAIYFRRLMLKLKEAFHTDCSPLTFRLNLESVIVPCRTAADLGLLINEAVTNSFKHAVPKGASEICLTLARDGNWAIVSVSDNGPGFLDAGQSRFGGTHLMQRLAARSGATVEREPSRLGTRYVVRVPLPAENTPLA